MISKLLGILILGSFLVLQTGALAQDASDGKRLYQTYCAGCHGMSGKGDGPAAKALPVRPADHTRSAMNRQSDQFLYEIIAKGGASLGKSAQMPAWGAVLKEAQVRDVVVYIRSLSDGKKDPLQNAGGGK